MHHVKKAELIEESSICRRPFRWRDMPLRTAISSPGWELSSFHARRSGRRQRHVAARSRQRAAADAFLRILPECGGQSRTVADYVEGAPELVAEIAASERELTICTTSSMLIAERREGVSRLASLGPAIDWFVLRSGRYESALPSAAGFLVSQVFPGLWLDPAALLRGDMARVLAVVPARAGRAEHADSFQTLGASAAGIALGQDFLGHVAMHVGQAEVAAGVAVGEPLVIEAEEVQDGGVQGRGCGLCFRPSGCHARRRAVADAPFDAAAGSHIE